MALVSAPESTVSCPCTALSDVAPAGPPVLIPIWVREFSVLGRPPIGVYSAWRIWPRNEVRSLSPNSEARMDAAEVAEGLVEIWLWTEETSELYWLTNDCTWLTIVLALGAGGATE